MPPSLSQSGEAEKLTDNELDTRYQIRALNRYISLKMLVLKLDKRASGEIGRHAGFRFQCRETCRFKSYLAHHLIFLLNILSNEKPVVEAVVSNTQYFLFILTSHRANFNIRVMVSRLINL